MLSPRPKAAIGESAMTISRREILAASAAVPVAGLGAGLGGAAMAASLPATAAV